MTLVLVVGTISKSNLPGPKSWFKFGPKMTLICLYIGPKLTL